MEISGYMEAVSSARALLLDEDEALEGSTTISLETCPELVEDTLQVFIASHFDSFLTIIRHCLRPEEQAMLLAYFLLSKPQHTLATHFSTTQTDASSAIRESVKTLGACLYFNGPPPLATLQAIFTSTGLEDTLAAPLSAVVQAYAHSRSFHEVALHFGLHRPVVRRAMARASKALMESKDGKEAATAAWVHSLINHANAKTTGVNKASQRKLGALYIIDPDLLGEFRIDVTHKNFDKVFVSRTRTRTE
jgi:hypothetical protein